MVERGEIESSHPATAKETAVESLKQQGNAHFVAKRYAEAIQCYSSAIGLDASNHVLFGNRSAARCGVGDWDLAADDARRSIELEARYIKGFYRLAQALIETGELVEAASAVQEGLRVDPTNREMIALKKRIIGRKGSQRGRDKGSKAGASGAMAVAGASPKEAAGRLRLDRVGLYDDKDTPQTTQEGGLQNSEEAKLKGLFSSLRDSVASRDGSLGGTRVRHELDGMFSKLIEPEQFRRIALPRLSEEERRRAPSSLQELLRTPLYASALEKSLPKVVSTAASVLEGVKRRGREQGDVMDAATEEALKPQVLQEAFAREVVNVITAVQTAARARAVSGNGRLASPTRDEASWDQLREETVRDLMKPGKGFSVQDSFLGDDWVSALLEDSLRFKATGKLHALGLEPEHGEMAWVEADQLEFGYPALHELIVNLQALAFELNLKQPKLRLSQPFQGSTMLLRLTEGCRVPVRLDSVAGGAETGHKVSAVYLVGGCTAGGNGTAAAAAADVPGDTLVEGDHHSAGSGGQLRLQNIEAAAPFAERPAGNGVDESSVSASPPGEGGETSADDKTGRCVDANVKSTASGYHRPEVGSREQGGAVLEPKSDRLVLFRSDCVSTETLEVLGRGREQYSVLFWMHGAREEKEVEEVKEAGPAG